MKGKKETGAWARLGSPELRHRHAGTAALPEEKQATGRGWTRRRAQPQTLAGTGAREAVPTGAGRRGCRGGGRWCRRRAGRGPCWRRAPATEKLQGGGLAFDLEQGSRGGARDLAQRREDGGRRRHLAAGTAGGGQRARSCEHGRCRTLHRRPWQQGRAPYVS